MNKSLRNYIIFAIGLLAVFLVDGWMNGTAEDCIKMVKGLVSMPSSGRILLESQSEDLISLITDLATGETKELPGLMPYSIVGPYKGQIVYFDYDIGSWVLVSVIDGSRKNLIHENPVPGEEETSFELTPVALQDGNKLLLSKPDGSLWLMDLASGVLKIFPFDDQQGILNLGSSLNWGRYTAARMVPNQDMKFVVYPANGEPGMLLNLRDIDANKDITGIHWGDALHAPQWSSDGAGFVTSAPPFVFYKDTLYTNFYDKLEYLGGNDLVFVGVDGEVRRLTEFSSHNVARQTAYSWSSDSSKLAFILTMTNEKGSEEKSYLSTLDLETNKVQLYCYPEDLLEMYNSLVWSPDGKFIAFALSTQSSKIPSTYFLDLATGSISEAFFGLQAVAWE